MDLQDLKLLAGRVRGLLEQSHHSIGHNQSLDLIAALPGLRNWPEVLAFPDRVAACELDATSAGRLAFRFKKKFELNLSPLSMLAALASPSAEKPVRAPQIWPAGPAPGVYITDSQEAINTLLERYEEATDGALVYAEKAASHWEGSIDLGDAGLWSNGLQRVPSGTLVVVGPLELNQQAWENSAEHLEMACLVAQGSGHRVAVLIETPTPASMFEDALLMVKMVQPEGDDCDEALIGEVAADGDLQKRNSFAGPRQHFNPIKTVATVDAIPLAARTALKDAIGQRTAGFLLFGASEIEEHAAIDLIAASLALTEHAGPAARIMPRSRSTPAKDWQVPEAIAQLPFLPSIESAFEQGIRRMVVGAGYTKAELLLKYGNDVLFICGAYDSNVDAIYMSAVRSGGYQHNAALLEKVIAILGVKTVPMKSGQATACDFYVPPSNLQLDSMKTGETFDFLRANRVLKWEDEMNRMLDSRVVTLDKIKSTLKGDRGIAEFLSARKARKPTATDER